MQPNMKPLICVQFWVLSRVTDDKKSLLITVFSHLRFNGTFNINRLHRAFDSML